MKALLHLKAKNYSLIFLISSIVLLNVQCHSKWNVKKNTDKTKSIAESVIRVNVSRQGYYMHRPWKRLRSASHTAIGIVVPGPYVLVTATHLANHRYIELEKIDSREKSPARIHVIDYEANLALLEPQNKASENQTDQHFLADYIPMEIEKNIQVGHLLSVCQVRSDGNIIASHNPISSIELSHYANNNFFLIYRLTGSLQYLSSNFTLPVYKSGKLAGLLLRSNQQSETIDVIPAPIIEHFLMDSRTEKYAGFPLAGFTFSSTLDVQLRKFLNIPDNVEGIYVKQVIKNGPADLGGLKHGDIITKINNFKVTKTGLYEDLLYGKVSITHLIRSKFYVGDKVQFQIFRAKKFEMIDIALAHRKPEEQLIPPYIVDNQPNYAIIGGIVFQELSFSYLLEYGKDWASKAPINLIIYDYLKDDYNFIESKKVVILSNVIPTSYTIGYENLRDIAVTFVNKKKIESINDLLSALNNPINGFHKIELDGYPGIIYLDPEEIPKINQQIRQRFHIPPLSPLQKN